MLSSLNIKLDGYIPANRDAVIKLTHEATQAKIERKPFLDGTLMLRDMEPGLYEMEVRHPNLVQPIERRKIRIFPQPTPTQIHVPVPADLFRDTPIRDIPDADLGPVQQLSSDVRTRLTPLAGKGPGEAIRSADWNTLVGAVQDLSNAVLELTNLVSPKGHDHSEIAEKIGEVQGNLLRFAEAFGRSLVEIRREIEMVNLRRNTQEVLDQAGASNERRDRVNRRLTELEGMMQADTATFTSKLSRTGALLLNEVNQIAVEQGAEAETFLALDTVKNLTGVAQHFVESGTQISPESELNTYQKTTTASGGRKLLTILR